MTSSLLCNAFLLSLSAFIALQYCVYLVQPIDSGGTDRWEGGRCGIEEQGGGMGREGGRERSGIRG